MLAAGLTRTTPNVRAFDCIPLVAFSCLPVGYSRKQRKDKMYVSVESKIVSHNADQKVPFNEMDERDEEEMEETDQEEMQDQLELLR